MVELQEAEKAIIAIIDTIFDYAGNGSALIS